MWPEDVQHYFGEGDDVNRLSLPAVPASKWRIAQEDRFRSPTSCGRPGNNGNCQWGFFLRNHDELTLEMVTDAERDYLWSTYAADPRAASISAFAGASRR